MNKDHAKEGVNMPWKWTLKIAACFLRKDRRFPPSFALSTDRRIWVNITKGDTKELYRKNHSYILSTYYFTIVQIIMEIWYLVINPFWIEIAWWTTKISLWAPNFLYFACGPPGILHGPLGWELGFRAAGIDVNFNLFAWSINYNLARKWNTRLPVVNILYKLL